jgi:TM2 domain-containing membrane protein YozV
MGDETTTQTHLAWREKERPPAPVVEGASNKKIPAGVCGILLGSLGVHKFILGYTKEGVIMLLVTVLTLGFASVVTGVIGLIEGIVYLTKSDAEFSRIYVQNRRGWF